MYVLVVWLRWYCVYVCASDVYSSYSVCVVWCVGAGYGACSHFAANGPGF